MNNHIIIIQLSGTSKEDRDEIQKYLEDHYWNYKELIQPYTTKQDPKTGVRTGFIKTTSNIAV